MFFYFATEAAHEKQSKNKHRRNYKEKNQMSIDLSFDCASFNCYP